MLHGPGLKVQMLPKFLITPLLQYSMEVAVDCSFFTTASSFYCEQVCPFLI